MEDADVKDLAARLRDAKLRRMEVDPSRFPYDRCPEQEKLDWEAIAHEAIEALSPAPEKDPAHSIAFGYTNWRGEHGIRQAIPTGLAWGSTEWHPEEGWLLEAWDEEKQAVRQFALADCDFTHRTQ